MIDRARMTTLTAALTAGMLLVAATGKSTGAAPAADKAPGKAATGWDKQAAARYLDSREVWWQGWDHSNRDHGTKCVSCHTQAPYALARPLLRGAMGETDLSTSEKAMLADVEKRVRAWDTMLPFYSDEKYGEGKEIESRNAESVLNAVILASYDAGKEQLSESTRLAFEHAWALQSQTGPDAGAWVWQNFAYTPWESKESQYHWAALMAMAVGLAPGNYLGDPRIAANLGLLRGYLRSHYDGQPLVNKIVTLWASSSMPELLTRAQEMTLVAEINKLQHPDGGWSLTDLGTWERRDKTPLETRSDGYATALIVLALEGAKGQSSSRSSTAVIMKRGVNWLLTHQDKESGSWPAWSLNKNRDPESDAGLFMTDAATGYAVMALENLRQAH
jgi:squalene-hopene/tetraprenyl-beta-curcumene cyclase